MPPAINRPQKITFAEMRSSGVEAIRRPVEVELRVKLKG
jgi:hypothetical protein